MMPPLRGWGSVGAVGGNPGLTHPRFMMPPLRGSGRRGVVGRNLGLTHPGFMMSPLRGLGRCGVVGRNLGLTHPGFMMSPLRGWGHCGVVAGLIAVAERIRRVNGAVGGQRVGTGLAQVHAVGRIGLDELQSGGVAVIGGGADQCRANPLALASHRPKIKRIRELLRWGRLLPRSLACSMPNATGQVDAEHSDCRGGRRRCRPTRTPARPIGSGRGHLWLCAD